MRKRLLSIDLAASEKRNTGIAFFEGKRIVTETLKTNEEILKEIEVLNPKVIGIDAPLSLPKGRKDIEDRGPHFRECDLLLRKMKIPFFPITLGPMRKLTKRGMFLKKELEEKGFTVFEIYPGGSLDLFSLKRKNPEEVNWFLSFYKLNAKNVDESDAAIGLFTLLLHLENLSLVLKGEDGKIILPFPARPLFDKNKLILLAKGILRIKGINVGEKTKTFFIKQEKRNNYAVYLEERKFASFSTKKFQDFLVVERF